MGISHRPSHHSQPAVLPASGASHHMITLRWADAQGGQPRAVSPCHGVRHVHPPQPRRARPRGCGAARTHPIVLVDAGRTTRRR